MNLQEQINRIQEMMTKIANEDFSDYGELTNPQKLEKDFQKYITTNEPKGVGKIHKSIGDEDIRKEFLEELIDRLESPRPEDELPSFKIDENELVEYIELYRKLLKTLESNNVPTEDLHGENIGRQNNKLIHFDVMDFPEQK